jgi:hypothetical protein
MSVPRVSKNGVGVLVAARKRRDVMVQTPGRGARSEEYGRKTNVYIFHKTVIHTTYKSRLGNKFRLITSHHQAFSFKNHSIKSRDCN